MKRLLLLLVVVGVIAYLVKSYGVFSPASSAAPDTGPISRARTAAAANNARVDAAAAAGRESDSSAGAAAGVTENMTPDQVRALIGQPDDVQTETLDSGTRRETWTYRSVGKTVVFENGVAVSIR
jgi:hypothetical protein